MEINTVSVRNPPGFGKEDGLKKVSGGETEYIITGASGHLGNTYAVLDGTPGVFTHKNGVHKIRLEAGSRLAASMGTEAVVNSFHHQAPDKLGEGLIPSAYSEDGIIEAFEHRERPLFGVQWHPEHESDGFQRNLSVYRMLIMAAGEGRA